MPSKNWSLIGIPDHQGVINVGGRIGASLGPAAFRRVFSRFRGRDGVTEGSFDAGDLGEIGQDVEKNLANASRFIEKAHRKTRLSVIVGGGHDHGYSHLKGIANAVAKGKKPARIGCINIDAHLDVRVARPVITSGSPFYLAIESGVLAPNRFIEFGIQRHCNGPELWAYAEKKKVKVVPFESVRNGKAAKLFAQSLKSLSSSCDAIVISLDLDAAASAFAPGVSAPQAEGFSSTDILEMMALAGKSKKVVSLGIFELNPAHDPDDRTARLGATAAYHFIAHALRR